MGVSLDEVSIFRGEGGALASFRGPQLLVQECEDGTVP